MQITIRSFVLPNYHGDHGGCTAKLRITADQKFKTSDGQQILKSKPGSNEWYLEVEGEILDTNLTFAQFTIDSTTDSNVTDATLTGLIYDDYGHPTPQYLFKHYRIPSGLGSTIDFSDIVDYNEDPPPVIPGISYTQEQSDARLDAAIATVAGSASAAIAFGAMRKKKYIGEAGYETVAAAVATIDTDIAEIVITSALTPVSGDLTTNCNTLVTYEGEGSTTVASGKTFLINNINAPGNQRRFFGSGTTLVGPNGAPNSEIRIDWWASKCNTDDITVMVQAAMDSAAQSVSPVTSRGGIVRFGTGTWYFADITIPDLVTIIGAGNSLDGGAYGNPDIGTTLKIPVAKIATADCVFRLPERYQGQRIQGCTISIGDSLTASAILAEGDTLSGLGFSADKCTFQGTLGNVGGEPKTGPSIVKFHHTATNHWEFVGIKFTQCWWQVPEASIGLYTDSVNSVITLDTCQFQCAKKATAKRFVAMGWLYDINPDNRGLNIYNYTETFERTISLATITNDGTDFAPITLDASTPSNKQFKMSDIGEPLVCGDFTAYIRQIYSPLSAVLSWHPDATITAQPVTMNRWDDFEDTAYAAYDMDIGAIVQIQVIGGADEGFNYTAVTSNSSLTCNLNFQSYTAQGRIKFTGASRSTFRSCHVMSCAFEDVTAITAPGQDIVITIEDCSWEIFTPFRAYLLKTEVWRTRKPTTRRIKESGMQLYDISAYLGTDEYHYPFIERIGNPVRIFNPQYDPQDEPSLQIGVSSSTNIPAIRIGQISSTAPDEVFTYYYDFTRDNVTGKFLFEGSQVGYKGYTFDSFVEIPELRVVDTISTGGTTSYGSVKAVSKGATKGIGYGPGAGDVATQGTSRTTAVTCNAQCGYLTTYSASGSVPSIAQAEFPWVEFRFNNNCIEAYDHVYVSLQGSASLTFPHVIEHGVGYCIIRMINQSKSTADTAGAFVKFVVIKGAPN